MMVKIQLTLPMHVNRIRGVNVSVLDSSAVGRRFEPRSGQYKDYKIGIVASLLGTQH
jgi:hypothetical protein